MADKYGTGPLVALNRVRQFLETPEVATPWEVSRIAQQLLDTLTAHSLNEGVIREQQLELTRLEARVSILAKMVAETPVDQVVANVKRAADEGLQAPRNGAPR